MHGPVEILVDSERFLSLPCDSEEYLVFDRKEGRHHLLRDSAARLWHRIQDGGRFDLDGSEAAAADLLFEAGLAEVRNSSASGAPTPNEGDQSTTEPAVQNGKVEGGFHNRGKQLPLRRVFGP